MATKPKDDSSLSHTRWNCKYHIVFIPKYRR
ncbi:MAG: IS200/IS605 family transposase, partial [Bulleidia sp.]|nr:IS200/IS605 family transposase [Bulleidia sp.]MDY6035561.1 IS200/IS605 family transposase [Bulleidia sp.]